MATKYLIQTTEPVPVLDHLGAVTGYTNGIDGVDSYTYNPEQSAIIFVKLGANGFIPRELVRFVTPYDDTPGGE